MKSVAVVAVGLALLAPSVASARDVVSETPDPVAWADDVVTSIATNGSRTLLGGDLRTVGRFVPDAAVVSAAGGEPLTITDEIGEASAVIADAAGGWYAGGPRHLHRIRPDGRVDPAFSVTIGETDRIDGLALSPDGSTLWLAGYFDRVNGESAGASRPSTPPPGSCGRGAPGKRAIPAAIVLSPDGRTVYVAGSYYDERDFRAIVALDAVTGALRAYGPVGAGITLALAPDGGSVYLLDAFDDVVYALDSGTLAAALARPGGRLRPVGPGALTPMAAGSSSPIWRDSGRV